MKVVLIADSYVHNQQVEAKLSRFLDIFKQHFDICLISNTKISQEIQDKVNYFIYDNRNQLFSADFEEIPHLTIFREFDDFRIETDISGNQPHGLSVLVNLFNQLIFCKSLGYTHVIRLEIDADFLPQSPLIIKNHIEECLNLNKSGFFYNENESTICQYFFTEIDLFLNRVHVIKSERDYKDFLIGKFGYAKFINVESFLYYNINNSSEYFFRNNIHQDFSPITWNTEVSNAHLESSYRGCITNLTRVVDSNNLILYSENFTNQPKYRKIKVISEDSSFEINHRLDGRGYWAYNQLPNDLKKIEVFENDVLLYTQTIDQIKSRFIDKTRKKIYFDIGCNVGEYTQSIINNLNFDKVIAIDANPELINFVQNRYRDDSRIFALNRAVSKVEGEVDFFICNTCDVISTCDESWINDSRFANRHGWNSPIKVQTISIDKLIELYGKPIHIKVDVEGYELNVIESMTKNYGCEIRFEWSEERLLDIIKIVNYLSSLGYSNFGCMFEDRYDGVPVDYKSQSDFVNFMTNICDINRRELWGMIYCN